MPRALRARARALASSARLQQAQIVLADAERATALDRLRAGARPAARSWPPSASRRAASRSRSPRSAITLPISPPHPPWRARRGAPRRRRAGARSAAALPARPAEAQPPLRPDGPKPAISRSTIAMRRSGCSERQEVGGPEPGEARADDGHVAVAIARQRRARRERLGQAVQPEAARPVAGLQRVAHVAAARPSRSSTRVPLRRGVSSTMRVANVSRK